MADEASGATGRVAWVAGASRGVGRGLAVALGRAGWTVYVTARSSAAGRTGHLPGTVEETADAVTAAGGRGIAIACDHRADSDVAEVTAAIAAGQGRLDLLVNSDPSRFPRRSKSALGAWPPRLLLRR